MRRLRERALIYTALAVLCVMTAVFIGIAAGLWSFIQVVAVTEFIYWIAKPPSSVSAKNFKKTALFIEQN